MSLISVGNEKGRIVIEEEDPGHDWRIFSAKDRVLLVAHGNYEIEDLWYFPYNWDLA